MSHDWGCGVCCWFTGKLRCPGLLVEVVVQDKQPSLVHVINQLRGFQKTLGSCAPKCTKRGKQSMQDVAVGRSVPSHSPFQGSCSPPGAWNILHTQTSWKGGGLDVSNWRSEQPWCVVLKHDRPNRSAPEHMLLVSAKRCLSMLAP